MNRTVEASTLRLALPNKGQLSAPTLDFLAAAGLKVSRPNERQYVATIPSVPDMTVLFQRAGDISTKVDEGSADVGITGYDIVREKGIGRDNTVVLWEELGYGACELVLAVPEYWIDVTSTGDFADLSASFKGKGKILTIATKYPNLTKEWLYDRGIIHFSLVEAEGALEAAPSIGYADVIVDVSASGTTLRDNRLKQIAGGTILKSQACLIANKRLLRDDMGKLRMTRTILEFIEAHLRAKQFVSVATNIHGESPEAVVRKLHTEKHFDGLREIDISKVFSASQGKDDLYSVSIMVERALLLEVVDQLRKAGGANIKVSETSYLFDSLSLHYEALTDQLRRVLE